MPEQRTAWLYLSRVNALSPGTAYPRAAQHCSSAHRALLRSTLCTTCGAYCALHAHIALLTGLCTSADLKGHLAFMCLAPHTRSAAQPQCTNIYSIRRSICRCSPPGHRRGVRSNASNCNLVGVHALVFSGSAPHSSKCIVYLTACAPRIVRDVALSLMTKRAVHKVHTPTLFGDRARAGRRST